MTSGAEQLPPIVDAAWLQENLDAVAVCDVRWYLDGRWGVTAFEQGHIPGAVFVDLDRCLAGRPSLEEGRHPLPRPDGFAGCMSAAGVSDGQPVVAYDDQGGAVAARLVWLLRSLDHPAALLDGGLSAWPGSLSTGPAEIPPRGHFTVREWPRDRLASVEEVERAVAKGSGDIVLVDARAQERYRGDVEPVDPRAGHIPGAVNVPFSGNLDPDAGVFLPPGVLRERYEAAGVRPDSDVVVYCGSGVTACHDLLALEAAGLTRGRLYAGSWSQWSQEPDRPARSGGAP